MPDTAPSDGPATLARVRRWEDRTTWPLFAGSLLLFGCATLLWVDQHPSAAVQAWAVLLAFGLWVWFLVDYLVRLALAKGARAKFFRSRIFDLVSIVLPFLRPFLIVIYVWRLPVFRYGGGRRQRQRYTLVTLLFGFIFVWVCSYLVWLVEKGAPGANILNFEDALWWGFATIATVGYGDFVPITPLGRTFAVGLMMGGIVIVGLVTATLISSLTDRIRAVVHVGDAGSEGGRGEDGRPAETATRRQAAEDGAAES